MAKEQFKITLNDKEYTEDDLNPEQKHIVNHLLNLEQKIGSTQFQLEQLQVGKQAFVKMLEDSLKATDVEPKEVLS